MSWNLNKWVRQTHRWVSIAFTVAVIVNIVVVVQGKYTFRVGLLAVFPLAYRIHTVLSIPILGHNYRLFEEIPHYAARVRFVVVPVLLRSGVWMWKGHVFRRLISKRSENYSHENGTSIGGIQIQ
jgi:hypothetical protein